MGQEKRSSEWMPVAGNESLLPEETGSALGAHN